MASEVSDRERVLSPEASALAAKIVMQGMEQSDALRNTSIADVMLLANEHLQSLKRELGLA